ncbi:MAG: hypothetical protein DRP16_02960, partial [Candidatus Aenigmatarchaeota archaeon]
MKLSESLSRNILETSTGIILNKFKVRKRRNIFFFDDIGLKYIEICEKKGFGQALQNISKKWGYLLFNQTIPFAKKQHHKIIFNTIISQLLKHQGY